MAADMVGPTLVVAGARVSNAGRPRLPIRLIFALLYLKHAYNQAPSRCPSQGVYFQFFGGQVYSEPRLPCEPAELAAFAAGCVRLGVEQLLKATI